MKPDFNYSKPLPLNQSRMRAHMEMIEKGITLSSKLKKEESVKKDTINLQVD